jgi:hypothetical protein
MLRNFDDVTNVTLSCEQRHIDCKSRLLTKVVKTAFDVDFTQLV